MPIKVLTHPVCDLCDTKFSSAEVLSVHMKNIHNESDSMRITRLEKLIYLAVQKESIIKEVQIIKSYDCTECGILFGTSGQQSDHNDKYHKIKVVFIEPDNEFLTQNTRDLEEMLKSKEQHSYYKANKCKFGTCWKSHTEKPNEEPFSCFSCK